MVDFKKSLAIGLQAAQDAEIRRKEIQQVIAELDKQIFEATNKMLRISVGNWDPSGLNNLIKIIDPGKFHPTMSIIATTTNGKGKEALAKWEQSKDGYPCQISIGSDVFSCEDKAGLENCLGLLLKDPTVGEKLHKLMS